MANQLEIALHIKAVLGEGPVWDEKENLLYWIDSLDNKVFRFNPETGENKTYDVGESIGFLALREKGGAVIGLRTGFYFLDLDTGALEKICDPEEGKGNRVNDGKADAKGRIWAGSMAVRDNGTIGLTQPQCGFYMLDTDLQPHLKIDRVGLSNGLAWTEDNKTMYYIDSPTMTVVAYDFDLEKGEISNKRVVINIPQELQIGDGMDIDTDGNLWIAHWKGWAVAKWDPRTGEMLQKIDIPVERVASCAFGGKEYDELYITTACVDMKEEDWEKQPHAGCLFRIKPGAKGRPFFRFKG